MAYVRAAACVLTSSIRLFTCTSTATCTPRTMRVCTLGVNRPSWTESHWIVRKSQVSPVSRSQRVTRCISVPI